MSLEEFAPLGFIPSYTYEQSFLPEGGYPTYHFRWTDISSIDFGPTCKIHTGRGATWYGIFEEGSYGLSQACCGPTAEHLCVVASGIGYIVPVEEPSNYVRVRSLPIVDVRRVPGADVLLFVDFSNVVAYGAAGLLWMAEGVSLDGIHIHDVTAESILGIAEGDDVSPSTRFRIDVRTGRVDTTVDF